MLSHCIDTLYTCTTWRWPTAAETCRHRQHITRGYKDSCVFDLLKFPAFYETRWLTTAHHSSLSWHKLSTPSQYCKIHFNIILSFTPWSSKWYFSFTFCHQNPSHMDNDCMEDRSSWQVKCYWAKREVPRLVWNLNSNYHVYRNPCLDIIWNHINSARA
jgi:hypothetical protein